MAELQEIRRFGGVPQKNSGRGKHSKGDAIWGRFLVDVKEYSKSFSLNVKMWAKVSTDAATEGLEPTLNVVLGEEGKPRLRLWVITDEAMQEYQQMLQDKDLEIRKAE